MDNAYFFAQDHAGNTHKVHVNHHLSADAGTGAAKHRDAAPQYALDDGTQVTRVDNDTFQVAGTGAFITLVRD